jgi:hypothetical protein
MLTSRCHCRFNAEIDFDGSKLLERYMMRQDVPRMKGQFKAASGSDDDDDFQNIMKAYGTEVVRMVGSEVRLCAFPALLIVHARGVYASVGCGMCDCVRAA